MHKRRKDILEGVGTASNIREKLTGENTNISQGEDCSRCFQAPFLEAGPVLHSSGLSFNAMFSWKPFLEPPNTWILLICNLFSSPRDAFNAF